MKRNIAPNPGEELHAYWRRIGGSFAPANKKYPTGWYGKAWQHGEKFGCRWVGAGAGMPTAQYSEEVPSA